MVLDGLYPGHNLQGHVNIITAPNYATDWRVNVPKCINLLIGLQDFLILADPSALPLAPNEGEPDLYTPVTDPNGNLVHVRGNNHQQYTAAFHLSQDEKEIVLPQLASNLLRAVDYHGQQEDGRIYGPTFPNLMAQLGMDDLQSAAFQAVSQGFMAKLQDVVSTIVGGLDNADLHYQFTACVCPFPEAPFDRPWEIDAPSFNLQVPIRNLSDRNILTYRGVVPLRAEGSFLRIYPGVEENNTLPEIDKGKLIFVPHGSGFLIPGELCFSDGIRTSLAGNPRLVFWVFVVPTEAGDQELPVLPISNDERIISMPGEGVELDDLDPLSRRFFCREMESFSEYLGF
jgi:hypothetical protein